MRMYRIVMAALALGVALPAVTEAQVVVRAARRGMLGFASNVIVGRDGAMQRVIVDVVGESPAEKAGVIVGDTLVRFNGLQPSNEVLAAFQPGDTVTLRLRRGGRERDVRVIAGERANATIAELPEGIRNRMAITLDAMRAEMDTVTFPRLRIERLHGDSTIVYFGGDRVLTFPHGREPSLQLDSIRTLMLKGSGELRRMLGDSSLIHIFTDTVGGARAGARFRMPGDSSHFEIITGRAQAGRFMRDTTFVVRPGELVRSSFTMGMRAIAGAELFELNPALGESFGTLEGVLVLNAADGTPAARAGLRGGDVIVKADGEAATSINALRKLVERAPFGSTVKLEVLRRGTRTTIELPRQ